MLITIHKIEKYNNKWKVTFTSERNQQGMTIYTPAFDSVEKLVKHLEEYIENNFPKEVITEKLEFDSEKIQIEEPEEEVEEVEELSEEEQKEQELMKQLEDLENKKSDLANQIKNLLEDWKLDLDLINLRDAFGVESQEYEQIIQDKLNRKLPKYIELKTQYEEVKSQINELRSQLEQE